MSAQKRLALSKQSKSKGFTLIELLVVISIIAILSIVGLVFYSNTQKNARDARRKIDIESIANALELNRNANSYQALNANWFASGSIPSDPLTSTIFWYCFKGSANATPGFCSASDKPLNDTDMFNNSFGNNRWIVCANLEADSLGYYCKGSSQ